MNYFNYFTEIEDAFVRRRGKHLLLSPADWALIESWKTKGVPLHIALRGIERSFDSHEAKPRRRSVKTLFYCEEEVQAQYAEWLDSRMGAAATTTTNEPSQSSAEINGDDQLPFPREAILGHLQGAAATLDDLRRARHNNTFGADEFDGALERAVGRLNELRADFERAVRPQAQALEEDLTRLEALLDRALRSNLGAEDVARAEGEAAAQLRPYKDRMAREAYDQTRATLTAKALRERAGIPRLSLFYI